MFKKTVIATLLALSAGPLLASDYFVVVPVPARTATAAKNITVSLSGFSLPSGLLNTPYVGFDFRKLLAVTGDPAYTGYGVKWSVVSGSLPAGLVLNSDGTLSGTPTAAGTSSFQVMASYKSKAGQQAYQVQVANITVGLAAGAPPQALVGQAYSYDLRPLLSVTGDSAYTGAGVTWSVVSSSLPAGLYLTSDGFIGGTPTAGGSGSITARATYKGANGQQTYQVVSLDVSVALAAGTPPQAIVGQTYAYSLNTLLSVNGDSAFSGTGVTWSVVSSSLPAGLYLTNDGWIGGTPTASGSGSITARATYRGVNGQQTYQVVSLSLSVGLAAGTPPQAIVGQAYSYSLGSLLTVSGDPAFHGSGVTWSAVSNSLPAGLSLGPDGTISGTPTAAGTGSITARASYKGVNGQQVYQVVSLNVSVALAAATPPQAIVGQPYSYNLAARLSVSGDTGYNGSGVTWSTVSSTLPAGLSLGSDGVITGTPTAAGTGSITAQASYKGVNGQQVYQVVSLNVFVALAAATPPQAIVGQAYGYDLKPLLTVTGDNAYTGSGVTWSMVSSTLPAGLYLTSDGWIGGTPTASGTGSVTARATYKGVNGQQSYQVVTLGITVGLAAGTPPQAIVGQAYSYNVASLLSVSGDSAYNGSGVTWSTVASSLPAGLSLGSNGVITGTPTAAGTGSITAQASYKGVNGQQVYQVVSLNIAVNLAAATPPQAIVGQAYTYDLKPFLSVTGDAGYSASNVTWTVDSGSLPAGLSLGANGVITGTPTAAGTGSFAARAMYRGVNGTQTYQVVTLNITVALANATAAAATADDVYSYDLKPLLTVSGDSGYQVSAVTWALTSGTLPTGLTLNTSTGVISGTPARSSTGTSTFSVTASYRSKTGQGSYTLNVAMAPAKPRWSVTSLDLGSTSLSGTATTGSATLYNDGGVAGNWTSLNNLGSGVTADASGCSNVAPSGSCVVNFTFKPTVIGSVNLSGVTPTSSASRAVNTLTITAAGAQRILALSPAVGGKSSWNLDTDGPLRLAAAGTYTVVPQTSMAFSAKLWGGGGGGGGVDATPYYAGLGGGGGYVGGTYQAAKSVTLTFNVGGGGSPGTTGGGVGGGAGGWNGGGKGGNAGLQGSSGGGGGGGGLTEMVAGSTEVACAGGGGGGGGDGNTSTNGNNNGNWFQSWGPSKTGASGTQRSDDGGGSGGGGGGCNGGAVSTNFPFNDSNGEGGSAGYSQNYGLSGASAAQPGAGGGAANAADSDVGTNAHGGVGATTSAATGGTAGVVVLR